MARGTEYSLRSRLPDLIVRERDNVIEAEVQRSGATVAPSSATVSVYRADGTALLEDEVASIVNGVPEYTINAASLPDTEVLGSGWLVSWTLTMPDGVVYQRDRKAALVRKSIWCPLVESDLTELHASIGQLIKRGQRLQTPIDAAWSAVLRRLLTAGRRPWLVLGADDLFEVTRAKALEIIFRDAVSGLPEAEGYQAQADHYRKEYDRAWGSLVVTEDTDQDGLIDPGEEQSASGTTVIGGPGNDWPGALGGSPWGFGSFS